MFSHKSYLFCEDGSDRAFDVGVRQVTGIQEPIQGFSTVTEI